MRKKFSLAATAAVLILTVGSLAQAQQSPPSRHNSDNSNLQTQSAPPASSPASHTGALDRSTLHEVKDDTTMAKELNINTRDLRSMAIYGSDGKKIGEVDNVLADSSNNIKAVTADVGGFLGLGSREVVIPIDKLKKGSEKDRLQTAMTKAEIQNLGEWSDTSTTRSGRNSVPSTPNGTPNRQR